jgi:chromosome segregation ATPase
VKASVNLSSSTEVEALLAALRAAEAQLDELRRQGELQRIENVEQEAQLSLGRTELAGLDDALAAKRALVATAETERARIAKALAQLKVETDAVNALCAAAESRLNEVTADHTKLLAGLRGEIADVLQP